MKKEINSKIGLAIILALGIVAAVLMFWVSKWQFSGSNFWQGILGVAPSSDSGAKNNYVSADFKKFASAEDFKNYLAESSTANAISFGGIQNGMALEKSAAPVAAPSPNQSAASGAGATSADSINRVSSTNVQVLGVDEPDIVKTDGKEIYFSPENIFYYFGGGVATGISPMEKSLIMPPQPPVLAAKTKAIKAFPLANLGVDSKIPETGNLLLSGNNLAIFSYDKIYGYDVSDPKNPKSKWNFKIGDGASVVGSRLFAGKIYLTVSSSVNQSSPCPIRPLAEGGANGATTNLEIQCQDIYYPIYPVSVDSVYSIFVLNPDSGKIEKTVSFVGPSDSSLIYVSHENIYVSYYTQSGDFDFLAGFFKEKLQDLVPSSLIQKLDNLKKYDISEQAKMVEFSVLMQKYQSTLSQDEFLRIENEVQNRMQAYYDVHKRELETTKIVKIGLSDFKVSAEGEIPGRILNQFSLDEYQGNLRAAITVGNRWLNWGIGSSQASASNDVYVLNSDLNVVGSVKDLGQGENIYSARFVGDRGYLTTFKNTDPFFVMDLSNPKKPEMKGELKISGYSSYLHPVSSNLVLGIGQDQSKVKVSLFDVSDSANPKEIAKYLLNEYWTDVSNNHHAFLLDEKHEAFFLPGGQGGYVFSYKNNGLELVRAVSDNQVKRAIYVNDYLYVIGETKITVLNESDWTKAGELSL